MTAARISELERALRVVAYVVVRHGEVYGPILERLQHEIEAARSQPDHREMARRILAGTLREVKNVPAA